MTKRFSILAALVLVATSALAAERAAFTVFATDPGRGVPSPSDLRPYSGGWGIGGEYHFTPRVSAAVEVSTVRGWATTFNGYPSILPYISRRTFYPVDAVVRYHFPGNERWKPYAGIGARGVNAYYHRYDPLEPIGPIHRSWYFTPEANAGVTFMVNKRLGIDVDEKYVMDEARYAGTNTFHTSFGFSWHF